MAENERKWFGKGGVGQLLTMQKNMPEGVSPVLRTMAAAYKQLDDIEYLLGLIEEKKVVLTMGEQDQMMRIKERNEKYRTQA